MNKFLTWIGAVAAVMCIAVPGFAQDDDMVDESNDLTSQSGMSDTAAQAVKAPSPRLTDPDRVGFFQVGIGPGFAIGLDTDNALFNILGSYNRNINENWSAKAMADFYLGAGNDSGRMINLEVGADYYLTQLGLTRGLPYINGDVGWGFARNGDTDETENAPVIGIGTGMKFLAADMNWDVNAHYSILTSELENTVPSVFGLRAAVNF